MRKQTTVLLLLLLLTGLLRIARIRNEKVPILGKTKPATAVIQKSKTSLISPNRPAPFYQEIPSRLPKTATVSDHRLLISPLTNALISREGSYTNLSDFIQGRGAFSTELKSRWLLPYLFPGRDLPELRIRITKDPETDEYHISGGTLSLPRTGLEAGYEVESDSDEHKATLQWKKEF